MTAPVVPKKQTNESRIPVLKSQREEAEFWDTHDLADSWDELKPVRIRFAKNLSHGITIRLDPETLAALRTRAHEQGLGPTTLARMWILERLKKERRGRTTRADTRRNKERTTKVWRYQGSGDAPLFRISSV